MQQVDGIDQGFGRVDDNANTQYFVQMMDRLRSIEPFQEVKRQNTALLAPQAGDVLLDVGCGTGEDAQALAGIVGPTGRVIGVDGSETMLVEARERAAGKELPVEFLHADAGNLPFADATFDGARSDRVLQHVENPEAVLAEIIRVTRSGGRIAISDTDWGMQAIDASDREITRRILKVHCDITTHNGWIGRQLPGLFARAGLQDIRVLAHPIVMSDYEKGKSMIAGTAGRACKIGAVTADEATAWQEDLRVRGEAGQFFVVLVMFTAFGRVA